MERRAGSGSGSGHDEATVVTTQLWLSKAGAPAGLGQRTCMGSSPGEGAMASGLGSRADRAAKIEGREYSGLGQAGTWAVGRSGRLWARAEAVGVTAGAEAGMWKREGPRPVRGLRPAWLWARGCRESTSGSPRESTRPSVPQPFLRPRALLCTPLLTPHALFCSRCDNFLASCQQPSSTVCDSRGSTLSCCTDHELFPEPTAALCAQWALGNTW